MHPGLQLVFLSRSDLQHVKQNQRQWRQVEDDEEEDDIVTVENIIAHSRCVSEPLKFKVCQIPSQWLLGVHDRREGQHCGTSARQVLPLPVLALPLVFFLFFLLLGSEACAHRQGPKKRLAERWRNKLENVARPRWAVSTSVTGRRGALRQCREPWVHVPRTGP